MKKCLLCGRELTTDINAALGNNEKSFIVDTNDLHCETCDARGRASFCVRAINADMVSARKIAKNNRIQHPQAFLEKKLAECKEYWGKLYTETIIRNEEARTKYEFWLNAFWDYIDNNTQIYPETNFEKESKVNLL